MWVGKDEVLEMMFQRQRRVFDYLPKDDVMATGYKVYFINSGLVKSVRDLTYDHYAPWNGQDCNNNMQKSRTEKWNLAVLNGIWFFDKNGKFVLKKQTSVHARDLKFRREIWTVVSSSGELISDVCYIYYAEADLVTPECLTKKIIPSTASVLKEALMYRTTTFAKKALADEGYQVTASQLASVSRSVPSHLKKKTGPKPISNYHEIYNRYVNRDANEIEMMAPVIEKTEKGKICFRAVVGFTNAFKHFSCALPSVEEVMVHRHSVEKLDVMNEREANRFFETFLIHESASGTLPCGASLILDTTFDLSHEYVTVACGYSEFFKNARSKKNSTIILGYMLHTDKTLETHRYFSDFLNVMFLRYAPNRMLNCVIHDGEDSFKTYTQGDFLRNAIALRCDIHRLSNIKEHARESSISSKEAQTLFFGEKRRNSLGTFLKKGLLQALTKNEYERIFQQVIVQIDHELQEWLLSNKEDLYIHNSMRSKLLAGFPAQYASTNVLEARNAQFKQLILRKEKAEKVMDVFLHIHRDEMNERLKAAISLPSSLECSDSLNHNIWIKTHTNNRRMFLSRFGLENLVVPSKCDRLPSWIFEGIVSNTDSTIEIVDAYTMHASDKDSTLLFLVDVDRKNCIMMKKEAEKLVCYKDRCIRNDNLCVHILAALVQLPDDELNYFLEHEEKRRNQTTCRDILKSTVTFSDGSKMHRRGKPSISRNYSRKFHYIINDSMESINQEDVDRTERDWSDNEIFE